jgi:hypothetical protein
MLTIDDIKLLIEAEKEVFPTKADFEELRTDFNTLQTSVDKYAKKTDTYHQELTVWFNKVKMLEEWAKKVSEKVGIALPF